MLPEFEKLSLHDQTNLIRRSIVEMILLRQVIPYNFEKGLNNSDTDDFPDKYPQINVGNWFDTCMCNSELAIS